MSKPAATQWFKYSRDDQFAPRIGEWCLWTMVVKEQRNYFAGMLVEHSGKIYLNWNGYASIPFVDDSVYWARVIQYDLD